MDACPMARRLDLRWLSDPHRSPTSVDTKAADLELDFVSVLGFPKAAFPEGGSSLQVREETPRTKAAQSSMVPCSCAYGS